MSALGGTIWARSKGRSETKPRSVNAELGDHAEAAKEKGAAMRGTQLANCMLIADRSPWFQ
jgi:hypothetical protein